jgi:superoxide reductase
MGLILLININKQNGGKRMEFYRCKHCGNIVTFLSSSGVKVKCCNEEMEKIVAGSVDASKEKHVPVYHHDGKYLVVEVGSVAHPMVEEHYIEWIAVVTNKGNQIKMLKPNEMPKAKFLLDEDEKLLEVYAYCNLHGLWKA